MRGRDEKKPRTRRGFLGAEGDYATFWITGVPTTGSIGWAGST